MGFRQHITEALLTPPESHEKRRDLLISAGAMLAVAVVSGLLARWLILGGLSEGWDAPFEHRGNDFTPHAETLRHLLIGGGFAGFLALILLLAALVTLAAALRRPQPRDP